MVKPAAKIDPRNAQDIVRQIQLLMTEYVPDYASSQILDPIAIAQADVPPSSINAALVQIFARFAELTIQRLNQVPDRALLAFWDLLGASRLPPQPARVPITFSLATGTTVSAIVPAGTQVAAPPTAAQAEPVVFETERDLILSPVQLRSLLVFNLEQGSYQHLPASQAELQPASHVPLFQGNQPIERSFYLGHHQLLSFPAIKTLTLTLNLERGFGDASERLRRQPQLDWQFWDGANGISLSANKDETRSLTETGSHMLQFTNLTAVPITPVDAIENRWLRCRLLTPITTTPQARSDRVRDSQLPVIQDVTMQVELAETHLPLDAAFTNQIPLDLSQDFFPFGERPQLGDTLYLASQTAFSQPGAKITLEIDISNPHTASFSSSLRSRATASTDPALRLAWECWNGKNWESLSQDFSDTTQAFTDRVADHTAGKVILTLPSTVTATTVNGIVNFWIRVRIASGNYGEDISFEHSGDRLIFKLATYAPPLIRSIQVSYQVTHTAQPEAIITYADLTYQTVTTEANQSIASFAPFQIHSIAKPVFYLSFGSSVERFPNQPISLYFQLTEVQYGQPPDHPSWSSPPQLVWQYWSNRNEWTKLIVRDDTQAFTRSGLVEFLPPADMAAEGISAEYRLRVIWDSGDYLFEPRLQRLLLNTTMATQTVTIRQEILGSSDGSKDQIFRTTQTPILLGQQLEVQEPELPSVLEREQLIATEGNDVIPTVPTIPVTPEPIWVRWHEVSDFYGSGPRDRHYVLDHLTGEIRFGNGINGLIPPIGVGNLRMARYQTGGGTMGNQPAGVITQLQTSIPSVDKAVNPVPAIGGANAESLESLLERMPCTLRHRNRAVTLEDYEDLARLASPAVARSRCVPLHNLALDPLGRGTALPGTVSVIIVPRSTEAKPIPSLELINRVQTYLQNHAITTAEVIVVGPLYLGVNVTADISLMSLDQASTVEQALDQALTQFLHPLIGGSDGRGWNFGRKPHPSDLYALLESIPGVDHIRSLQMTLLDDSPGAKQTDRFLVYSGHHTLNLLRRAVNGE